MNNSNYMQNLSYQISLANRKALRYRDGKAWDNKKKKTMKRMMPRGRAYRCLCNIEWKENFNILDRFTKDVIKIASTRARRVKYSGIFDLAEMHPAKRN